MASLQDVFVKHWPVYVQGRRLHSREWRAATSIMGCCTPQAGSHHDVCASGHASPEIYHACRHRSCPRCAERPRLLWVQAELNRLLPCPHFHVVFTLPHELLALWEFNREAMISLLMGSVRASLLDLLADPRHLGATPGLLLSLHTWGRNLSHHPHVHALITAGGVRADGRWVATREGYLVPLAPLRKLFCGKLLAGLREQLQDGLLRCPADLPQAHWRGVISRLYRKHWNIQINPAYASGRSVALYLARYVKGGPLPRQRELHMHSDGVSFEYTDHRDGQRRRQRLDPNTFIARILWHAPPKGVHVVRHAGLYGAAARVQHRQALLSLIIGSTTPPVPSTHATSTAPHVVSQPRICTHCGAPLQRRVFTRVRRSNQFSIESVRATAQGPPPTPALGPTRRSTEPATAGRATWLPYRPFRAAGHCSSG